VTQTPRRNPSRATERRSAPLRGLAYLFNRWILNSSYLLADVPAMNLRLKVRTRDVIGRHLYKYRQYEPELTAFLRDNLRLQPRDVVLDIGANLGWYSLLAERLAPAGADIFAFEPDPENYKLLTDNLRLNDAAKVTPLQKAVAERDGTLQLHRYKDSNLGRHSLLPINAGEAIDVPAVTLDGFWRSTGLGDRIPRLVKIDVEGYELPALRGARQVLSRCPLLLAEYSPTFMRAGGIAPGDLLDYLCGLAMVPFELADGELKRVDPDALRCSERHTNLFWRRQDTLPGNAAICG
jgi:FkbM family methyltransferase